MSQGTSSNSSGMIWAIVGMWVFFIIILAWRIKIIWDRKEAGDRYGYGEESKSTLSAVFTDTSTKTEKISIFLLALLLIIILTLSAIDYTHLNNVLS
jgi:uncharacterized membrane protein